MVQLQMCSDWLSVKALVFDMDGTLLDTEQQIVQAASQTLQHFGYPGLPPGHAMPNMHGTSDRLIADVFAQQGYPLPDTVTAVGLVFEACYRALPQQAAPVYAGAVQWLQWAQSQGLALAICTNKKQALAIRGLEAAGLLPLFSHITGRDTYGIAKPEAAPLLLTLEQLQVRPQEAIFIGDTHADAGCAQAAGVRFWWFSAGFGREQALAAYPKAGSFASYRELLAAATGVADQS